VKTSGLFAPDVYTLTITTSVQGAGGIVMYNNFVTTFTVTATTTTTPVLSVPNFARGPGQTVALNDSLGNATGIPIDISNVTGLTSATFNFAYDPNLLTIAASGAVTLSSLAEAAGVDTVSYTTFDAGPNAEILIITVTSSGSGTGLTDTTPETLVTIAASVPTTAPYLDKTILSFGGLDPNGQFWTGQSSVQVVAYLGDVLGTGIPNATDASLVDQVGSGAGTGFSIFKDLDPVIIAGVENGSFNVNATDASLINQAASGQSVGIPAIPGGFALVTGGPDPYLYLSAVQGQAGQTVTETLYLDVTDPNGIQLTALNEAIGFDSNLLQISNVRAASGLAGLGSYATASTVDNGNGVFLVGQAFMGAGLPPVVPYGADIPVLTFDVTLNADMTVGEQSGLTLLQYGSVNGVTQYTSIGDNEGELTFTPGKVPSNSGNAAVDGTVTVVPVTDTSTVATTTSDNSQHSAPVQPRSSVSVRRVTPISQPLMKTVTETVIDLGMPASSLTPTLMGLAQVAPTTDSQPATTTAQVQPEFSMATVIAPDATRSADAGASLSLTAQGLNKPATSTATSIAKPATTALDEVYRTLGSQPESASLNGLNLAAGTDATEDAPLDLLWDTDSILEE
jgi:hypothetical protein